jgi:hypothetical protein
MELKNKLRIFHSITEMQRVFGLPQPLHPLISILDYNEVEITQEMVAHPFVMDFYNITYNDWNRHVSNKRRIYFTDSSGFPAKLYIGH